MKTEQENYKIEKNILIPKRNNGRISIYPFALMEIGDSFQVSENYSTKLVQTYSAAARMWANRQKHLCKFAIRKYNNGIRIWRIR